MMGSLYVAVAVLSLLSVGQSAPVTSCDSLIQPLEIQGRDQLLGRWTYIAESTNITGSKLLTKMFVESAWSRITAANESDAVNHYQAQKMFGRCFTLSIKLTLKNSTLSMEQPYAAFANLLSTGCADCLVLYSKFTSGGNMYSGVQLLSRRNKVSYAEQQEFMKQVECLNLPPPAILDPEKGSTWERLGLCAGVISKLTLENNTLQPAITNIRWHQSEVVFCRLSEINLLNTLSRLSSQDEELSSPLLSKRRTVTDSELEV